MAIWTIAEQDVVIETPDGLADCYFVHPNEGQHAAVLLWPDILGLRPAFRMMGKRLAEAGYAVLVPNLYYRTQKAPLVAQGASFADPEVRSLLLPLSRAITPEVCVRDGSAYIDWLDQQPNVDKTRKIGTAGYCLSGSYVIRLAAARSDRIAAGASFHGVRLVTDTDDSPHLLVGKTQAEFLIAIAENDDAQEPEAKTVLREAFASAEVRAEIEVYQGAMHGWCPPDTKAYDEQQANKAWSKLLTLFERNLAAS